MATAAAPLGMGSCPRSVSSGMRILGPVSTRIFEHSSGLRYDASRFALCRLTCAS